MRDIRHLIRTVPDHPKPGIQFRDVTPLVADPQGLRSAVDQLVVVAGGCDLVAGTESRGFVFGAPVAYATGRGFILIRKAGKLPGPTVGRDYQLEYGTDRLEISAAAPLSGKRVVVVDDLLATGGTAVASVELLRSQGAVVERCVFVIGLPELGGYEALGAVGCEAVSLLDFADE